tara:strand:+ start:400 stop:603 length:204 start_codon:yes stop_codon:yes gene_type:complete
MIYYNETMPETTAFYLRQLYKDSKLNNIKEENHPKTNQKKEIKVKKYKMNRITSMDNFMKYSWSWTL